MTVLLWLVLQAQTSAPAPAVPAGHVALPLAEYDRLADRAAQAKKAARPPQPYVIHEAVYRLHVDKERVTGTLHGRSGSFALQHNGIMDRGTQSLVISVVPDSGTDQLAGISGRMRIIIEGKQHSYEFEYTLRPA